MSDLLSYPVSALMKLLHDLTSLVVDPGSGAAWVITIALLVAVVRLVLLLPAWRQQVGTRRSALLQPRLAELKRHHGADRTAYLRAAADLQRSEGVTLGATLAPMLVQLPVFVGIYHLLVGVTRAGSGGTGVLGVADVASFAHATLFGVPLSATLHASATTLAALLPGLTAAGVAAVTIPFALIAAIATFLGIWWSRRQQAGADPAGPAPARGISLIMMWASPLGLIATPLLFPIPLALVVYWAVNGTWSTAQSVLMGLRLDRLYPMPG